MDRTTSNTNLNSIRDAFLNDTQVELAIMDGAIATTGSQGLRVTCEIVQFSRDEKLQDVITYNIKAVPADNDNANPAWLTI